MRRLLILYLVVRVPEMSQNEIIFWDVDTQFDFMHPDGSLFIKGADEIVPRVGEIRRFTLKNGYSIIASMDWHKSGNEEISDIPDYKNTFPVHCLAVGQGASRVGFLGQVPIEFIENTEVSESKIKNSSIKSSFTLLLTQTDRF